jgi:hypothetical protein
MPDMVCYIPSYNDSDWVRESLASTPDWDVVISDNGSSQPHASSLRSLAGPRVRVIRQEKSLGRVGNWRFCVNHFIYSGASWMKFLFAGDLHLPTSREIYRRAIEHYPDARFIVPQVENIWPHKQFRYGISSRDVLLPPEKIMSVIVESGNVFPGLIAPLFHVDTVREGFTFGEDTLSFCADLLFLMNIAKRTPCLCLADATAQFIAARRRTMLARCLTLEHLLEEGLLRLRAVDAYLALGGDRARRVAMFDSIFRWMNSVLIHPPEKLAGDFQYPLEVLTGDAPVPISVRE